MNTVLSGRPLMIHPLWLRIVHWLNVVAVFILILSGWRIYNASPLFGFTFPKSLVLGGWLGGALQWHFAAMWLLAVNGLIYLALNIGSGRFVNKLFPPERAELMEDMRAALQGRLAHQDPAQYNAIQKFAYWFVIVDLLILVLSGMVMWKPVQFSFLHGLLGGYEMARHIHFFAMTALVFFVLGHTIMAALVPRTLRAMLRGR